MAQQPQQPAPKKLRQNPKVRMEVRDGMPLVRDLRPVKQPTPAQLKKMQIQDFLRAHRNIVA